MCFSSSLFIVRSLSIVPSGETNSKVRLRTQILAAHLNLAHRLRIQILAAHLTLTSRVPTLPLFQILLVNQLQPPLQRAKYLSAPFEYRSV